MGQDVPAPGSKPTPRTGLLPADSAARFGFSGLWPRLADGRYWALTLLLAASYFVVARLSLPLAAPPGYASAFWPPAGVAVAALLGLGARHWPGIWLGALLANFAVEGTPLLSAALVGAGNAAAAVVAQLFVARFSAVQRLFQEPANVWRFVAVALLAGIVAATVGVGSLVATGHIAADEVWRQWLTWLLGDAAGIVIVAPALLCWGGAAPRAPLRAGAVEHVVFWVVMPLLLWGVVDQWRALALPRAPLFLLLPVIAWAAMRLDLRAVTTTAVLMSMVVLSADVALGPSVEANAMLLLLQIYVSVLALTGLLLSAQSHRILSANTELESAARELEQRIAARTRELGELSMELRLYAARLGEVQDAERRKLAAELHDIVGQHLAALATELALLDAGAGKPSNGELAARVGRAKLLAKEAMRATRKVMAELRPPGADQMEFPALLRWYADAVAKRTDALITLRADATVPPPAVKLRDTLGRIVQEALNNAARHADASRIEIRLEARHDEIVLAIEDDGRGFECGRVRASDAYHGWGMTIMRERAVVLFGELRVKSSPGHGTCVELRVPRQSWS